MKSRTLTILLVLFLCLSARVATCKEPGRFHSFILSLAKKIPPRQDSAMTGSEFARYVSTMDKSEREQAIEVELTNGNLPDFLRRLKPVELTHRFEDGATRTATIFVMPDYVAIGPDRDFLLIPMNLQTAVDVATNLGFLLPTKTMVDAIFTQSEVHFAPEPMAAGPRMCSTAYYAEHNRKIERQRTSLCCRLGALVSGHKKDVVLSNRLARNQGKIAIYGWHRPSGTPIQPLSTIHNARYADYSHGIRLVSEVALIDGKTRSLYDVLEQPSLARVLNEEGAMPRIRQIMAGRHPEPPSFAGVFSR